MQLVYCSGMADAGPDSGTREPAYDSRKHEKLKEMFEFFDKNRDGLIDITELGTVLRAIGSNPTEVEVQAMIAEEDTTGSGTLNFDEFSQLIVREMQMGPGTDPHEIIESFKIFDHERNGFLSVDVFTDIMTTMGERLQSEQVEKMIKMCDINQDGEINYVKFVDMVVNAPNNLGLLNL